MIETNNALTLSDVANLEKDRFNDMTASGNGDFSNVIFDRILNQLQDAFLSNSSAKNEGHNSVASLDSNADGNGILPNAHHQQNAVTSDTSLSDSQSRLLDAFQQSLFADKSTEVSNHNGKNENVKNAPPQDNSTDQKIAPASQEGSVESMLFGNDGLELNDVFDSFNVLNHIPIVSDLYQSVSSRTISASSTFIGSYMMFGPASLVYNSVNMLTENVTGKSLAKNIVDASSSLFVDQESAGTELNNATIGKDETAPTSEKFPFTEDAFLELSHDSYR
ncbi:MAG: hypothetical protein AAGJ37_06555 [Pseudomonadota bacterium]